MRSALLGCLALLATSAAAQSTPPPMSAEAAYKTSLWGTVVPVMAGAAILVAQGGAEHDRTGAALLLWGGSMFGPALGYAQAGLGGRAWKGIGIRAGIELVTLVSGFAVCGMYCNHNQESRANIILLGGLSLVTVSAIYDITHLRRNVSRHTTTTVSFTPSYAPDRGVGMRVALRYAF